MQQNIVNPSNIAESINKKYKYSTFFFTTKFINELVFSVETPLAISYEDMKFYYDEIEYLRRFYRNKTLDGKNEIQDRIKLVSKYYVQNQMLTSEVPFMFITDTKEVFLKRQKKLKKLKQKDESSDQEDKSSSFGIGSLSLSFQQNYLKELQISISKLMKSGEASFNLNDELDSQIHDVYENYIESIIDFDLPIFNLKKIDTIQHLICDFQDVDVEAAINFYKDIRKSKTGSALMSQLFEQQQRMSQKTSEKTKQNDHIYLQIPSKNHKRQRKNSKQSILNNYIQIFAPKIKGKQRRSSPVISKPSRASLNSKVPSNHYMQNLISSSKYLDEFPKLESKKIQNVQEQIQITEKQMSHNRKKIRQKAQILLQKIKRESFSTDMRI